MAEPAQTTPTAATPAAAPKKTSAKVEYTVVDGKHRREDGTFARKGDTIMLEPKVADSFKNKFARVMVPADSEAGE